MRHIDTLRTLALGSVLILVLGGTGCASAEDASDTGEPSSVEAAPPAEAPEAADETSSPAEKPDTEASEAEESPSVDAAPPAEAPAKSADQTSSPAEKPDTEAPEAEEE